MTLENGRSSANLSWKDSIGAIHIKVGLFPFTPAAERHCVAFREHNQFATVNCLSLANDANGIV
jgi:hypothetical protein